MSYNIGAGQIKRTKQILSLALRMTITVSLILYAHSFCLMKNWLLSLPMVICLSAHWGLTASFYIFFPCRFTGFNTILMYYFQSVEQGRLSTVLALAKGVIFVVLGMILLYILFKENGIWLIIPFAEACACLLGICLYRRWQRSNSYEGNTAAD